MNDLYYMKDLVKGFVKWFIIVMLTLNIILWASVAVRCQYEPAKPKDTPEVHPVHKTQEDFEDTVGFRTVEFISKDHRLLFYKKNTKTMVMLGSFGYNKLTRFDSDNIMSGKSCVLYWILQCELGCAWLVCGWNRLRLGCMAYS